MLVPFITTYLNKDHYPCSECNPNSLKTKEICNEIYNNYHAITLFNTYPVFSFSYFVDTELFYTGTFGHLFMYFIMDLF